jgi:acyl phosphate:glycerol-3-phosphate acyltransferase
MEFVLLAVAYLLGSIPTGCLVSRGANLDIREHGSGSTGAANVWRTIGKAEGAFVFGVDLIKGSAAMWLMQSVYSESINPPGLSSYRLGFPSCHELVVIGAACLVILGHSYSCWIGFRGGKSAATGLGVLLMLNWMVAFSVLSLWVVTVLVWRTTSIGSITVAIAAPILMTFVQTPSAYSWIVWVGSMFILYRHRSNLDRLCRGTEPQIHCNYSGSPLPSPSPNVGERNQTANEV